MHYFKAFPKWSSKKSVYTSWLNGQLEQGKHSWPKSKSWSSFHPLSGMTGIPSETECLHAFSDSQLYLDSLFFVSFLVSGAAFLITLGGWPTLISIIPSAPRRIVNAKERSFLGHLHLQILHRHMKFSLTWQAHLDPWRNTWKISVKGRRQGFQAKRLWFRPLPPSASL